MFRALKLGHPLSVEASSTRVNTETYPLASMVTYHFPPRGEMPSVKLVWYDGNLRPPRPAELDPGDEMGANGHLFIGDKGKILTEKATERGRQTRGYRLIPAARATAYGDPPKKLPRSIGHHKEWLEACKGGPAPRSNFDFAGPLTEAVLLGALCIRNGGQKLLWDSANLKITNVPEANNLLHYEYRSGWKL